MAGDHPLGRAYRGASWLRGAIRPTDDGRRGNRTLSTEQFNKPCRGGDVGGDVTAASGGFAVFAPGLDLEGFVELRGGEGGIGVEPALEERESDHERAAGRGQCVQRGQAELVLRRDNRGEYLERRLGLPG